MLGFENPKAFGNAIHKCIERVIHLRKLGSAGVCTDNLNAGVAVMKSAQDGA